MQLMWRVVMEDDSKLEHIILEVERLWPPFFGGRRVCTQVCEYQPINTINIVETATTYFYGRLV